MFFSFKNTFLFKDFNEEKARFELFSAKLPAYQHPQILKKLPFIQIIYRVLT